MFPVKAVNRVENNVRHQRFRTDGTGIVKCPAIQLIWISTKNLLLAGSGRRRSLDSQENRDILVAVQPVGDEKWHDANVALRSVLAPIRNKWSFLHVRLDNLGI